MAESPELLGLQSRRSGIHGPIEVFQQLAMLTPVGRQIYPDIVLLAASGHVIVVEVKLASNPELRDRAVIAQIIDYASSFAALKEEDLLALFRRPGSAAETWAELVQELFPQDDRPDELAEVLLTRISTGELNLVIACDRVPLGLPEVVEGIASQKTLGFDLDLVEVVPFVPPGEVKEPIIFVPSTRLATTIVARTAVSVTYRHGDVQPMAQVKTTSLEEIEQNVAATRRRSESAARVWTPLEVEEGFHQAGDAVALRLLRFAKQHSAGGDYVSPAVKVQPTFGFYIQGQLDDGSPYRRMIFCCVVGRLTLYLDAMSKFVDEASYQRFKSDLLATFGHALNTEMKEPSISTESLEPHLDEFERSILSFQMEAAARRVD